MSEKETYREQAAQSIGDKSGFGTRMAGWFLAVILVLGIGLLVWLGLFKKGHHEAAPVGAPSTVHVSSPVTSGGSAPVVSADKGCANVTPNSDPATKLPNDISWQPVGIDSTPVSKSVGPFKVQGHFRMCYAHTPTGAAFGALNIVTATMGYNDTAIIEKQETDGPGKDEDYETQTDTSVKVMPLQLLAYHVDSYDGQNAIVSLVYEQSGLLGRLTQPMVWTNGDWYENGQPQGSSYPVIVKSIPAGYVTITSGSGVSN